jgi:hypothetical protein
VSLPGVEPGLAASETAVRIQHTPGTIGAETPVGVEPTSTGLQPVAWPSGSSVIRVSPPGVEPGLRPSHGRVPPPHSEDMSRADDWIRTSMIRLTKPAPSSVEPRRRSAGVEGFEPSSSDLETAILPLDDTPVHTARGSGGS